MHFAKQSRANMASEKAATTAEEKSNIQFPALDGRYFPPPSLSPRPDLKASLHISTYVV
jgi:hypothetical protein